MIIPAYLNYLILTGLNILERIYNTCIITAPLQISNIKNTEIFLWTHFLYNDLLFTLL